MSAPVRETMLAAELWLSFGSLVRSYAAAASLNLGTPAEVVLEENRIEAFAGAAALSIDFQPLTGAAHWSLRGAGEQSSGHFEILPEGRIAIDGRTIDLDHAAIDFAAALMQAAAQRAGTEL